MVDERQHLGSLTSRPRRHPDLAWRNWGGEVVILAPSGHDPDAPDEQRDGAEHDLNEVASRVWELCDGVRSVSEIARVLIDEFEIDLATAERDAADFVAELVRKKLLLLDEARCAESGSSR
jgi:Coenzyme PQQ synthesis protein D (PqqD)